MVWHRATITPAMVDYFKALKLSPEDFLRLLPNYKRIYFRLIARKVANNIGGEVLPPKQERKFVQFKCVPGFEHQMVLFIISPGTAPSSSVVLRLLIPLSVPLHFAVCCLLFYVAENNRKFFFSLTYIMLIVISTRPRPLYLPHSNWISFPFFCCYFLGGLCASIVLD